MEQPVILKYELKCKSCPHTEVVKIDPLKIEEWRNGALIQDAFPNLTLDQRELLKTQTCGECWNKLFGGLT
jgi:hypothetical protein